MTRIIFLHVTSRQRAKSAPTDNQRKGGWKFIKKAIVSQPKICLVHCNRHIKLEYQLQHIMSLLRKSSLARHIGGVDLVTFVQ